MAWLKRWVQLRRNWEKEILEKGKMGCDNESCEKEKSHAQALKGHKG